MMAKLMKSGAIVRWYSGMVVLGSGVGACCLVRRLMFVGVEISVSNLVSNIETCGVGAWSL
jgi:hypothetical protein